MEVAGAKKESEEGNGGIGVPQKIVTWSRDLKVKREGKSLIFGERV